MSPQNQVHYAENITCCYANGVGLYFSDYLKISSTNEAVQRGCYIMQLSENAGGSSPFTPPPLAHGERMLLLFYKVVPVAWKTSWDLIKIYNSQTSSELNKNKDALAVFQTCSSSLHSSTSHCYIADPPTHGEEKQTMQLKRRTKVERSGFGYFFLSQAEFNCVEQPREIKLEKVKEDEKRSLVFKEAVIL